MPGPTELGRGESQPNIVDSLQRAIHQIERTASSAPDPADRELGEQARTVVLNKLTARARSRAELAKSLRQQDIPEPIATEVLDRMSAAGLVDDASFAQEWVRSRQGRRHLSQRRLQAELADKGVADDVVAEAIAHLDDDADYQAAMSLARTKMARLQRVDHLTRRRRLAGMLERRGFSMELVRRVLREVLAEG